MAVIDLKLGKILAASLVHFELKLPKKSENNSRIWPV